MQKYGWEFHAALSGINHRYNYSMAIDVFLGHFNEHSDLFSAKKVLQCCRKLHDFHFGFEFLARPEVQEHANGLAEEIFFSI